MSFLNLFYNKERIIEKLGNAIPCKYDLTFSAARKNIELCIALRRPPLQNIVDHGTAFSPFSVITEELCYVLLVSEENESLSH